MKKPLYVRQRRSELACRARTERPAGSPGPGNLRCDLRLGHPGEHRAGFRILSGEDAGKKGYVLWFSAARSGGP